MKNHNPLIFLDEEPPPINFLDEEPPPIDFFFRWRTATH